MRDTFIELLRQKAIHNPRILLLTGDLGFGVLNQYRATIPNQFLNVGIAEQNMTGVATGLALEGYKVFTYSIGNFCSLRCLEQIRNDVCYHRANVKIISIGSGLGYGSLGMSHHATEDVSILRALPYLKVYSPSDFSEVNAVVEDLIQDDGPAYVRIGKNKIDPKEVRLNVTVHTCNHVKSKTGNKCVLLTHGSSLELAKAIVSQLKGMCDLYTLAQIKPLPQESLLRVLQGRSHIITLEEHNLCGGFGSSISEFLHDNDLLIPLIRLGLPDQFIPFCGSSKELCDQSGLSLESCLQKIKERTRL